METLDGKFFKHFNDVAQQELKVKSSHYDCQGLSVKFEKIVTVKDAVAKISSGDWVDIM